MMSNLRLEYALRNLNRDSDLLLDAQQGGDEKLLADKFAEATQGGLVQGGRFAPSAGGPSRLENGVILCPQCHQEGRSSLRQQAKTCPCAGPGKRQKKGAGGNRLSLRECLERGRRLGIALRRCFAQHFPRLNEVFRDTLAIPESLAHPELAVGTSLGG